MPDIEALSDKDHVRMRPGMYIGSTHDPQVALREIIDNAVDEVLSGHATKIWINKVKDGVYRVADNGRGISIKSTSGPYGRPITMVELAFGSLRAGSKFHKTEVQAGLHGVGSSVVNFLSERFEVYVRVKDDEDIKKMPAYLRGGYEALLTQLGENAEDKFKSEWYYFLKYVDGIKKDEGFISWRNIPDLPDPERTTIIEFEPSSKIWSSVNCDLSNLDFRYTKFYVSHDTKLNHKDEKHLDIYINDKLYIPEPPDYKHEVNVVLENPEKGTRNNYIRVYATFGISDTLEDNIREFSVNTLNTQTGVHTKLFDRAFTKAFEDVFGDCKGKATMGINLLCIMGCEDPSFSSQTKEKLSDIPGYPLYSDNKPLVSAIKEVLQQNRDEFMANYTRIIEYLKSKESWDRLSEIKAMLSVAADSNKYTSSMKPKKLRDCTCKDRRKCELIITEGRSASGSLTKARAGMDNIAILPLLGKPQNVIGKPIKKVLDNDEMHDLINSIGCGVNDYHDVSQIRYGKVIINTDGDSDGYSIAALLLGAILSHLTFLIDEGMVFIARCPLYGQDGKYYYFGEEDKLDMSKPIKRWKGLGEMDANELRDCVLNKETRNLMQVTKDNVDYCVQLLSDTEARKKLMIDNGLLQGV